MPQLQITGADAQGMVSHWLGCPPNGYLGSPYGSDPLSMLQKPLTADDGNAFIAKMKTDIPLLQAAPAGTVNVYQTDDALEKRDILIEVAGTLISAATQGVISS